MTIGTLLLLDCGNSAVKCQLLHVSEQHLDNPQALFDQLQAAPIERIDNTQASADHLLAVWKGLGLVENSAPLHLSWVSVGPQAVQQAVRTAFHRVSGTDAPSPWQPCAGVAFEELTFKQFKNHYDHPEQLGADRWVSGLGLAAQGMLAPGETHLIVSAGTATTVDLISSDHHQQAAFLGGWILPGIQLMNDALRVKTRDLDGLMGISTKTLMETDAAVPTDSRAAISQGIGLAQTGFVSQIAKAHHVTKLWLHGGDAAAWRSYLSRLAKDSGFSLMVHDAPHLAFAGLLALQRFRT